MLSYEQCLELKNAGFPQPSLGSCQFWWQVRLPARLGPGGPVLCVYLPDTPYRWMPTDELPIGELRGGECVYAPTVEDMLSLLKPEYFVQKVSCSGWGIFFLRKKRAVFVVMAGNLFELFYRGYVSAREIFENAPNEVVAKTDGNVPNYVYTPCDP